MEWLLAEAKNKLSEVINLALTEGPQKIRRRKQSVIIIAEEEYAQLTGRPAFKNYLMQGPSFEELDLSRDPSASREVSL